MEEYLVIVFQFKGNRQNISHQTFTQAFNEAGWLSLISYQDCLTNFFCVFASEKVKFY